MVSNIADAVARVQIGGTILIESGTWDAADVMIDKSVTIQPATAGERPIIRSTGEFGGLVVSAGEVVTIRGMTFDVGLKFSGVSAEAGYGHVIISDCEFSVAGGRTGVYAGASTTPDAYVSITGSKFSGGDMGVFFANARAETRLSTFDNHAFSGIQYQGGSRGTIEGNTSTRCGIQGCIRLQGPVGVTVTGNRMSNVVGREVRWGIIAFGAGTATVRDNEVIGTGVVEDRSRPETHTARTSAWTTGIIMDRLTTASVSGNHVVSAHMGVSYFRTGGNITGNELAGCGHTCVAATYPLSDVMIADNVIRADGAVRITLTGIYALTPPLGAAVFARNNQILASAPGDASQWATYSIAMGIQAAGWGTGSNAADRVSGRAFEATGNVVRNAQNALTANFGGVLAGRDNIVDVAFVGLLAATSPDGPAARNESQRNDISAYVGLSGGGNFVAKCNWWGTTAGPSRVNSSIVPSSSYQPVAAEPIAGKAGVTCG